MKKRARVIGTETWWTERESRTSPGSTEAEIPPPYLKRAGRDGRPPGTGCQSPAFLYLSREQRFTTAPSFTLSSPNQPITGDDEPWHMQTTRKKKDYI